VGRAAQAPEQPIEVIVRADGKLSVRAKGSDQSVSLPQLVATVRARQGANADVPVVIAADKEVRYEMVVKVMDALQKEGVKRVGLAVKLAN
jgi:biopolymer transport protein TolR